MLLTEHRLGTLTWYAMHAAAVQHTSCSFMVLCPAKPLLTGRAGKCTVRLLHASVVTFPWSSDIFFELCCRWSSGSGPLCAQLQVRTANNHAPPFLLVQAKVAYHMAFIDSYAHSFIQQLASAVSCPQPLLQAPCFHTVTGDLQH